MNKRIRVRDRFGRPIEEEDEDGRIICPDGGVCHVDMQFLDARNGRHIVDKSRAAYERYCDRLSSAGLPPRARRLLGAAAGLVSRRSSCGDGVPKTMRCLRREPSVS